MKNNDRLFLFKIVASFSIAIIVSMGLSVALWEWLENPLIVCILSIITACAVGYVIVSYLIASLLKTNRFLDLLLKDTLHELNIPLSVIKANLQMLQKDESDPKVRKRLERISLASDDLYLLYKEVDYFIKKEIHKDVREEFSLDELATKVIKKQKEITPNVPIETENLHVRLYADRHGLSKVIANLLNNATKYNYNDRPIKIVFEEGCLRIQDQGIGMSEAELFLAFNRYYQADSTKEGYGIGLSLVKAYCDESGIVLRINSSKNNGTEVILGLSRLILKK